MTDIKNYYKDLSKKHTILLRNIKRNLPKLKKVLDRANTCSEDDIYRYYHYSFKVYRINTLTREILALLFKISPYKNETKIDKVFNKFFIEIINEAFEYSEFKIEHNEKWSKINRCKLEAFFHAKYFIEQAIKYSTMKRAPNMLPSGWASLLHLYNIR